MFVIWDGTPHTSRQLFIPDEIRREPQPLRVRAGTSRPQDQRQAKVTADQQRVLALLQQQPRTATELAWILDWAKSRVQWHVYTLQEQGLIKIVEQRIMHAKSYGRRCVPVFGVKTT